MRKKIFSLLLCLILCVSVFTGCTLFEFDSERDAKQVIAVINAMDIPGQVTDFSSGDYTKITKTASTFKTKEKKIYKSDLFSILNQNVSAIQQQVQNGTPYKEVVDKMIIDNQLVLNQLILNEANARIYFGEIYTGNTYSNNTVDKLGVGHENEIKKSIYDFIDGRIEKHRHDILKEHNMELPSDPVKEEEKQSTYPKKEEQVSVYRDMQLTELKELCFKRHININDNADKVQIISILEKADAVDVAPWAPSESRFPGLTTNDEEMKSLYRQTVERFLSDIEDVVKDDFRVTADDKAKFDEDFKAIDNVINTKGILYVYPMLADTYIMQYLIGNDLRDSLKIRLLQEHINYNIITVSDSEILDHYNRLLETQKSQYQVIANYDKAMSEGKETVLYHPQARHFYVKQILVPFSEAQKADLEKAKSNNMITSKPNGIENYRQQLADGIMSYVHVDGEDSGEALSIFDIYNDIKTTMAKYARIPKEAERAFDDLIYKYNTDPGIFGKALGYPVKVEIEPGDQETYVKEFAQGARDLYADGKVGDISGMIVTDFGVHILYLSRTYTNGEVIKLDDFESYAEYTTIREKMFTEAFNKKMEKEFTIWKTEKLDSYQKQDGVIVKYEDRYKEIFKESK